MLLLKLKNLPALRRGLEAFGERVRVAAGEAVREGAARIAASAKGRVAVKSSQLRDSIRAEAGDDPLSAAVRAAAPYARQVEFGTLRRPARPFLLPAFEQELPGILLGLRQAIAKITAKPL